MATVFKAYDTRLQRTVALKILHEHLSSNAELRLRFEQEAQLAARIDHPNIVRTYDFGLNKSNQLFIVNEFIDGRSLTVALRQYKTESQSALHPILAALVALEISKGVEAAHQHSVIHRDLKPDNVLVSMQGEIKLTDFGVARPFDSSMTQVGQFIGSLTYASPEQIKGEPLDVRSDLFSLGVMLFEILTGRLPFRSSNPTDLALKISRADVEPLSKLRPSVPKELDQIVRQCLRAVPSERPQSATSIVSQLENYLKNEQVIPSNSAISDGFMNPELFTSTIRRGPILQVERPAQPAQINQVGNPAEVQGSEKGTEPLTPHSANKAQTKYRSLDPKRGPQATPNIKPSKKKRRYASLILTTASITVFLVTLIVKERERITQFIRGGTPPTQELIDKTISSGQSEPSVPVVENSMRTASPEPPLIQTPKSSNNQHSIPDAKAAATHSKKLEKETTTPEKVPKTTSKPKSTTVRTSQQYPQKESKSRPQSKTAIKKTYAPAASSRSAPHTKPSTPRSENKAATGQIVVKTQPGEMTVFINGVFEGLSSRQDSARSFTIQAGNVTLKIPAQENNGRLYREYVGRFRIEPGQSVTIPTIVLVPADGYSKGDP